MEKAGHRARAGAALSASVICTTPIDSAVDVVLDTLIKATFSEAVDPLSVTTLSFTLEDALGLVPGTVTTVGSTVTFVPGSGLDADTLYTATITTDVTDLSGNALIADYVWSFTTGDIVGLLAPSVTMTSPSDLAMNVPTGSSVSATFSEDMDPLTLSTATFTLMGPGNTSVLGIVQYDALSRVATFEPSVELEPETSYVATITMGAEDLTGTSLLTDYTWDFSTGLLASVGPQGLDLGSLETFVAVAGAGLTNSTRIMNRRVEFIALPEGGSCPSACTN